MNTTLRPEFYEWWINSIQNCLFQISGIFNEIIDDDVCKHICDETYIDLDHFVKCVISNKFNDIPIDLWIRISELSESKNLENDDSKIKAKFILDSLYFKRRKWWIYNG